MIKELQSDSPRMLIMLRDQAIRMAGNDISGGAIVDISDKVSLEEPSSPELAVCRFMRA